MKKTFPNSVLLKVWLLIGWFLVLFMVIVGGATRLTGSGLSIVQWNLLSGILPPLSDSSWIEAFEQYKAFPEYQKVNLGMSLPEFKSIFYWEYFHRLLGRLTGLFFFIPLIAFRKKASPALKKGLYAAFILVAIQGLAGWYMVKSGLVNVPHVSHYRLALHMFLAFSLGGLIFGLITTPKDSFRVTKITLKPIAIAFAAAVMIQSILGAFVAGLKAGFSYNTFPLMDGSILPLHIIEGASLSSGPFIQLVHRWFAWIPAAIAVFLYLRSAKTAFKNEALFLLLVVALQVTLGILTLLFQVPVVLGVVHQVMAFVLFSLVVRFVGILKS